tara:strand:+ start:5288 stop:6931 length:1644 start_codon:yes stop_codon:yes gene_type:complete
MLFTTIFNIIVLCSIIGFSYLFKYFISQKKQHIHNSDILYGIFTIIVLSLILNFFLPLKYFFYPIIIIGCILFLFCIYKNSLKINLLIHFIVIFSFALITYDQGDNVDSPMYHMQIIKWLSLEKIIFGLPNLEIRFGMNSLWFNFLSMFQFKYKNFNSIHILNFLPFTIVFYEILMAKKKNLSYIFLTLSICFLIFFSYLHPFNNGVILNQLHNPELDTVAMIFFIYSFYLFLKFFDEKKYEVFQLLLIASLLCFFIKISYIGVLVFPLSIVIIAYAKDPKKLLYDRLNLTIIFSSLAFMLKGFITSGCLLFPVKLSCFNTAWSPGIYQIDKYSKIVKGFARDTRDRQRYTDFDHTIESFDWFLPWFYDYAVNNALFKISFILIILSLFIYISFKVLKLMNIVKPLEKKIYLIGFCGLFLNFLVWFQAPDTRFGWGIIISLNCFILAMLATQNKLFRYLNIDVVKTFTIIVFFLILFDNRESLKVDKIITPYEKNFNYSKIIKFSNFNGYDFFVGNWQCYDFKGICVNSIKKNYNPIRKNGYLFFLN